MRKPLYKAKQLIHKTPWLYEAAYNVATLNRDYLKQKRAISQFNSKFGGMWTDRSDFEQKLAKKTELTDKEITQLKDWRKDGIVTLENVISHDLIDQYLAQTDALGHVEPSPLRITSAALPEPTPFDRQLFLDTASSRLVDDYVFSPASRQILFNAQIKAFLNLVFERPAILTQSLRFNQGSEQPIHQDTAFVRMNAPMKLVGVWIALEDIKPASGELLYLPGSHNWEGYLFSGRFKHYDADRDGPEQLEAWHKWILDEAKNRGIKPQSFQAKKGDVLFWHAALAHGGAPIKNPGQTRLSLVGHFCPVGVSPLYHYYKPRQRKIYQDSLNRYTTSYYSESEITAYLNRQG